MTVFLDHPIILNISALHWAEKWQQLRAILATSKQSFGNNLATLKLFQQIHNT